MAMLIRLRMSMLTTPMASRTSTPGPGLPCTRADRADCAEDAPLPDTATLNYSLMGNYFTCGGRAFGTNYTLNEFCVT
jgi:hypothetical protein